MRTKLKTAGSSSATELWFDAGQPEDLFAARHSAARLFSDVDCRRARKCDHCVLHFHDTSKKGTRRWCSMRLCGNRLKVAAYAARQRMGGHQPPDASICKVPFESVQLASRRPTRSYPENGFVEIRAKVDLNSTLPRTRLDRHRGGGHPPTLPHHRAYGSVHGGSSWLR